MGESLEEKERINMLKQLESSIHVIQQLCSTLYGATREEYRRDQSTGESPRHLFLKNVGRAFLYNQGCYLVDTEVKINHLGLKLFHELEESW